MFFQNSGQTLSPSSYQRQEPLILLNGLAEQQESWYANLSVWRQHYEVHTPSLLAYEGSGLQKHISAGRSVDVAYLVEKLHTYLENYVQTPPYHLVANSLGGKVAVEFAVLYPELVNKMVLLCPSGLSEQERLPIIDGVRRSDMNSMVNSVLFDTSHANDELIAYYQAKFLNRAWRTGLLKTVRGTMEHRIREKLSLVQPPTLLVVGRKDRIVDPEQSIAAGKMLPKGKVVVLEECGHAPQIEQADHINQLVLDYLRGELDSTDMLEEAELADTTV